MADMDMLSQRSDKGDHDIVNDEAAPRVEPRRSSREELPQISNMDIEADAEPLVNLDPAAPLSACGVLGFSAAPAIGAAPSNAYRPGYDVAKSQPGPRGGTPEAGGWGLIVPVTLYLPIRSIHWIRAMIQRTQFEVLADDETAVSNPGAP